MDKSGEWRKLQSDRAFSVSIKTAQSKVSVPGSYIVSSFLTFTNVTCLHSFYICFLYKHTVTLSNDNVPALAVLRRNPSPFCFNWLSREAGFMQMMQNQSVRKGRDNPGYDPGVLPGARRDVVVNDNPTYTQSPLVLL